MHLQYKKVCFIRGLILAASFFTILSQMPQIVKLGLSSMVSSGVWFCVFAILCLSDRKIYINKDIRPVIVMATAILAFWGVAQIFDTSYAQSEVARQIALSMFIMVVGTMCGRHMDKEMYTRFYNVYIWGSCIVTVSIFFSYLINVDLTSLTYAYASKNSIAQIILTSIIIIVTQKISHGSYASRIMYGLIAVFSVYILIALKSRACLVMLPVIALVMISKLNINRKTKRIIRYVLAATVLLLLLSDKVYETIINQVIFIGRKGTSLESLTTGRSSQWGTFFSDFLQYPFFGHGGRHRESLILTSYLEYGFLFGTVILIVAAFPIKWCMARVSRYSDLFPTMLLIAVCYVVNGIFEMLAPFGPGVKCFALWFLMGSLSTSSANSKQ